MVNVFFELDRLRSSLENKGVDPAIITAIVAKARQDINSAFEAEGGAAMEKAVEAGAEKYAPDFINQLRLDAADFEVTTESGNLDFSEPPYPMLNSLLRNAKPMADGSGVYKIVPVGKKGNKPPISTNIFDVQKRIAAERVEAAKKQYAAITPSGSKHTEFRTVTSKQDAQKQWVKPATEKDFTEEVRQINVDLRQSMDDRIRDIINSYVEMF